MHMEYSQGHVLGHKTSLNKLKKTENIPSIYFKHNHMKLEINYKNKAETIINICRFNNMLLNNYWVNEEIKEEIKRYIETNENEHTTYQTF